MADIAQIRQAVLENINRSRLKAEEDAKKRAEKVREKIPAIALLDKKLQSVSLALFDGARSHNLSVDEVREEYRKARDEKAALLVKNGFPADYTQAKYSCEICADTGFVGVHMCDCARKAIRLETVRSSGLGSLIETQSFDTFRLDLYSDIATKDKMSDRARMQSNLEKCKEFAESFSRENPPTSLMMVGKTGLGKTHLSTAIAARVLDRGFSVLYDSAANIFSTMEKVQYGREDEDAQQGYFAADLLIIDDLGTEFPGKFTASALFLLVNTRLNHKKPMIINTNLEPIMLEKRYEQRVFSRFFGEFDALPFVGEDARLRLK